MEIAGKQSLQSPLIKSDFAKETSSRRPGEQTTQAVPEIKKPSLFREGFSPLLVFTVSLNKSYS